MRRPAPIAAAALAALALCSCAGQPTGSAAPTGQARAAPRQCFWTSSVNSFASTDNTVVNVRANVNDVYQLQLLAPCFDVDWAQGVALRSRGGSSICTGLDAELIVPGPSGPHVCPVSQVRRLTPEEVAALPSRARP